LSVHEFILSRTEERPAYGSVGVVHDGPGLQARWIWREAKKIDPRWSELPREDLLYVIEGTLRLELEGEDARWSATWGGCRRRAR
jgi:hypothetical protein